MPGRATRVAIATLARLAPRAHRLPLAGDLLEELALREVERSGTAARLWLFRQLLRSAPPLLWAALGRTRWLSTLATALLAYVGVGLVEFAVNWALSGAPNGGGGYRPLGLALTFPAVVLIAGAASACRSGAPWVLAVAMLLAVAVMTLTSAEQLPIVYRVAYFIAGPAAVVLGIAVQRRIRRAL